MELVDLDRVFIRNKMRYPVRILVSLSEKGEGKYKRVAAKSEIGPLSISKAVHDRIVGNPNTEIFNF